jgi:lysine-ketoglutarate reductase/saccharopine dehydrogenase-like protein (TIGR00300 family)
MPTEKVEVRGHLLSSGALARILDEVLDLGGDYHIDRLDVGKRHTDESNAQLSISAADAEQLAQILERLEAHGAKKLAAEDALLQLSPRDGVFPEDFSSTTNRDTQVRLGGRWVDVANPEMDCGIIVEGEQARTIPVSDVRAGDRIVCGASGVRLLPLPEAAPKNPGEPTFEFMSSAVSSEKPQALLVRQLAAQMRAVKERGEKILWVGGPAIVHTGAVPAVVALTEQGYVDVFFAGNALAAHDIEAALYGTSLGVDLEKGQGVLHGHEHHIRAINRIRACGSIASAVTQGVLRRGLMHGLVAHRKEFVLVGSVRDDGPLPDVFTDVVAGQRAMRAALPGVGLAIMVATMLHSIATGNILPARTPLVCVDINPAAVTKLADRGSGQATGIVTDIGLFLEQLAAELWVGYKRD